MTTALQEHIISPKDHADFSGTKGSASNSDNYHFIPSNDISKVEPQGSVISKLKAQNKHLEYQLQSLKFQLQQFLEKKKTLGGRTKSFSKANFGVHSSMEEDTKLYNLQKELDAVYRETDFYKKEIKIFQLSHTDVKVLDRYEEAGNKFSEKQIELKCLEMEKKTLEKTLKEKNKLLRELQEVNGKVTSFRESELPVSEELKLYKSKVRDSQLRQQELEKDAQKRNQYILKLMGKLTTMKEDYRQMLSKTGYDPVEDRIKSNKASVSPIKRPQKILAYSPTSKIRGQRDEQFSEMRLETNEDNFEKLKEDVKDYKKLEVQKQKAFKLQMERYKEILSEWEKTKQEVTKKVEEKEMEASILRNKTKELYRQLLQLGLLPPGYDYEGLLKEKQIKASVATTSKKYMGRRSFSLMSGSNDASHYLKTNETPRGKHKGKDHKLDAEDSPLEPLSSSQRRKVGLTNSAFHVKKVLNAKHDNEDERSVQSHSRNTDKNNFDDERSVQNQSRNVGKNNFDDNKWSTPKSEKRSVATNKDSYLAHNTENADEDIEELVPSMVVDTMVKGLVYNGYRMDEVGQKMEKEGSRNFNDQEKIHGNQVKISKVRVFYDGDDITGFQTDYRNKQGQIIEGDEHTFDDADYKFVDLMMGKKDYLKEVSGYINGTNDKIESVCLVSNDGVTINAGQEKKGSKPFAFDINELEFPVMLHGSLKGKQNGKGSVLCRFGALIKSDEIEEDIQEKAENKATNGGGRKLKQIN